MRIRGGTAHILVGLLLTTTLPAGAQTESEPLPQPLRVEQALAAIDARHPALQRARAQRDHSEQALAAEKAVEGLTVDAHLEARWIEPNDLVLDDSRNDSRATLVARKLLSDFGHSRHRIAASRQQLEVSQAEEALTHAQHRLDVLQHYFDVLLADLAFARDTEAMASAFVSLGRARDRNAIGQVSDIALFELEARYETARGERLRALQMQRRSRAELAEILNRPGRAPAQVLGPPLPFTLPALPELAQLLERVEQQNPELAIRRAEVEVARQRSEAARTQHRPRLSVHAQLGTWQREFGGDRNPAAAGLVLDIPLYRGGRQAAALGQATADRHLAEAHLGQAMSEVRNAVRELFYTLEALQVQRDEAMARMDYRELYIDRARALYDMEEQADLGDSMVQQSAAAHFHAATEYALALGYERLAVMVGDPSLSLFPPDS